MSEQDVQPAATPQSDTPSTAAENVNNAENNSEATPPQSEATPPASEPKGDPEWFMKDKYKSIEDQARAQYDMQNRIGKHWGPPKDNYTVEGIEGINPNDPIIAQLQPALKEIGLSQEGFNSLVKSYQAAQLEGVKKMESDLKNTLTQEDAAIITDVDNRLDEDFPKEVADGLRSMITTKEDFYHLRSLIALIPRKTNVPSSNANATPMETVAQVEQDKIKYLKEIKAGKVEDKNHWDQLNVRFRDAYIRETQSKK